MSTVVGIRFRRAGKIYDFAPGVLEMKKGDKVVVETSRGLEFGEVVVPPHESSNEKASQPLKEVLRMATEEDIAHAADNKKKEIQALDVCLQKIHRHDLDMKLIDCEYTFDNSKILFYFTAEGRIDFRDLVKDLASVFHTRIELRQVGVRDETKILGGLGSCGRELCCHSYLSDFVPVSIKMAKEQNLSLNPIKISGVCGRLMCCLKNEEEVYEELNRKLPSPGDYVVTPDDLRGSVSSVNILKQLVKVVVDLPNDEKEVREYHVSEIEFHSRKKGRGRDKNGDSERGGEPGGEAGREPGREGGRESNRDGSRESGRDREQRKDRGQKSRDRGDRADRGERGERGERSERGDRNERADREKGERGERTERGDRSERADREKGERSERGRGDRDREKSERGDRTERSDRGERDKDRSRDRTDRDRGEQSDRGDRQPGQGRERSRGRDRNRGRKDGQDRELPVTTADVTSGPCTASGGSAINASSSAAAIASVADGSAMTAGTREQKESPAAAAASIAAEPPATLAATGGPEA